MRLKHKLMGAKRFRVLEQGLVLSGVLWLSCSCMTMAQAQKAPTGFSINAKKVTVNANGGRLIGNASITLPQQLDARADSISFDVAGKQITSVRANGSVNLKVNMTPRGGGAPVRVETRSDAATLDPVTRVLVLSGNVDGFYQTAGGGRNTLRGSKATISYPVAGQFGADVVGGSGGVQLVIPPPVASAGTTQQIGTITITGRNLNVNSANGTAVVTGNAHAVSSGGTTQFALAAPSFTVTRESQGGAFANLRTAGRTILKVNLPSDAAATATNVVAATSTSNGVSGAGRPTYFEVASDVVTINTRRNGGAVGLGAMTFDGNVAGFYRLQTADGKTTDNRFTGDHAVVQTNSAAANAADNFQIEVTGAPVNIQTPFNLGF
jgi:lipopolysaccharide export system protein LptA